ncbi:hypothetical protein [Shewanella woodyi]|uniref:hypothetical protein n=1 Tax=Shewanella woodyi TaxID=60961 RepID=UPI003749675F
MARDAIIDKQSGLTRRDKQPGVNAAVTFRDKDVTVEPTGIVLVACHRGVYTLSEPQAID